MDHADAMPDRPSPSRPTAELVRAWLHWFGLARLVVVTLAVLGVGAGGYWLLRAPAAPIEQSLPMADRAATSTTVLVSRDPGVDPAVSVTSVVAAPSVVVVYVAGAVVAPGVFELPLGARVDDAVAAAGGLGPDADLSVLNLAAVVTDGDRVWVPRIGEAVPTMVLPAGGAGTATATAVSTGPVAPTDLNRATVAELDALPGVGPSTAAAIVAHRDQNGPFASVDDLLDVRGIGPSKLDAIRALVTV